MITEKSNRLQVIMIKDYDYPISILHLCKKCHCFSIFFMSIGNVMFRSVLHEKVYNNGPDDYGPHCSLQT